MSTTVDIVPSGEGLKLTEAMENIDRWTPISEVPEIERAGASGGILDMEQVEDVTWPPTTQMNCRLTEAR